MVANIEPVVEAVENTTDELTKEQKLAAIPELMAEGSRAYAVSDLNLAAEKFSLATEYSVDVYDGPFAPECFEPHYQYGRALADLAELQDENPQTDFENIKNYISKMAEERAEKLGEGKANLEDSRVGDPDAVEGEERDEVIAAVDAALEENAQELETLEEKAEEFTEEAVKEDDAKVEEKEEAEVVKDEAEKIDLDETQGEEDSDEEMEEEEEEDATVAWEILEVARKICEQQGETQEWDLKKAKVLSILAQISLKEDNYEVAIKDLTTALDLNKKYLEANDRIIASSYFELGNAYSRNDEYLKAAEFFEEAKKVLEACIAKAAGKEDELKDLEDILKDVVSKIEDAQSSHRDAEKKKALQAEEEKKQVSPEKVKSDDENQEPAQEIPVRKGLKRAAEPADEEAKKSKVDDPADPTTVETAPVA